MQQNPFLKKIAPHLPYKPDSANYAIFNLLIDHLLHDGGDDRFANLDHYDAAFMLSKHVTLKHIEYYDNEIDSTDLYHLITFNYLLSENVPARFILFEIQNLMITFEPELPIKTTTGSRHTVYDTCENLFCSLLEMLNFHVLDQDETGDLYDLLINTP